MTAPLPPRSVVREIMAYDELLRRLAEENRLAEAQVAMSAIDRLRQGLRDERMMKA